MVKKVEIPLIEAVTLLSKGYSMAELSGISEDQLNALYALAYQHHNAKNYVDAANIFKVLCLYEPSNYDYLLGLASSEQGLKHYDKAAELYALACTMTGLVNPKPMYFACICLLKQNDREKAMIGLESIEIMGREGVGEDDIYKQKAAELLKILKQDEKGA